LKHLWSILWRKKSPEAARALAEEKVFKLKRELGVWELFLLVVGSTVGVGIFVLPGVVAAEHAGPGVIISFVLSGLVALSVDSRRLPFCRRAGRARQYWWFNRFSPHHDLRRCFTIHQTS